MCGLGSTQTKKRAAERRGAPRSIAGHSQPLGLCRNFHRLPSNRVSTKTTRESRFPSTPPGGGVGRSRTPEGRGVPPCTSPSPWKRLPGPSYPPPPPAFRPCPAEFNANKRTCCPDFMAVKRLITSAESLPPTKPAGGRWEVVVVVVGGCFVWRSPWAAYR